MYAMPSPRQSRSVNSAFTLIELLVVIAIIAILAAILFPVFAQAREQARKITCVSNLKQLTLGWLMYAQDYDETWVTSGKGYPAPPSTSCDNNGDGGDAHYIVQPYIKNLNIFFCPNRTETWEDAKSALNPTGRYIGYGMNYGPYHNRAGFGVFHISTKYSKGDQWENCRHYFPGRALAEFVSPADMVAQIETNDTPQFTNAPYDQCSNDSGSPACVSKIRHGGRYTVSFVDGHATSWAMKPYSDSTFGEDYLLEPADPANILKFCYNPDATIDGAFDGSDGGIAALEGANSCRATVDAMVKTRTPIPYP